MDATTGLATSWNPNAGNFVNSISFSGSNVYAGGIFTTMGGQPRNRLAAIDVTSGLATTWNPNASGIVEHVSATGSSIYVGGSFSFIGGATRNCIAALDAATGKLTSWNPGASGIVFSMVVSGNIVYAGGLFTVIGGQTRNKIAALDATTGLATAWNPNTTGNVNVIAKDGNKIYVGGSFTNIGGAARNSIAALDSASGLATSWNPNANGSVLSLVVSGGLIYAGGNFTTIGGLSRARVAALNSTTGAATAFNITVDNSVNALAISGNTIYVGGVFTTVSTGFTTRNRLAAYTLGGGLLSWNPNADNSVFSLNASRGNVFAGGLFTTIGGQTRNSLVSINPSTGIASSWNPNLNNNVYALVNHYDTLYTAGIYTSVNAVPRGRFAVFSFPCASPTITSQPVAQSLCQGATAIFTVAANGTNISYQWKQNGSNIGTNSPTLTLTSITPTNTGNYEVVITGNCGNITSNTVSLTVNAAPAISVNSGTICSGGSFTITPSGASTYTIQGGSAIKTPTANSTYTVTGTSAVGCISSTFATSSVSVVNPPTIIVNGGNICSGSSFTIVPSGASTYTFSGGSVVSPTVNTTYTVTGTDVNGCVNSIGSTLLVAINPPITNFSVAASSTNICTGQSATVTVASSQTDIKYYLRDDATNNVVVGPVNGTGGTLSFNTGTLTSNTTYNVYAETQSLGKKGLDFDGVNDVITTNITSSTTSSLTIEAWIFPRATTVKRIVSNYFNNAAQSGEIILDTYNATNNGRGLRLAVEGAGNTLSQLSIANVLTLNAWNHVAGTFNSGVMTLYVNGIAVTNNSVVPAPFTSIPSCTNSITIGEDPTIGALEYFNGKMDEVRIWNTTRTQAQIAGNMNNCLVGNENGLKNYFKFSEGAGSTVTDLVTGSVGNMSGMTPATAWVTGNVDCGGSICNHEMTQLVTITVNAPPIISVNSGSVCPGNSFTITPSGASTYTIQGGSAVKTPTANATYTVVGTSSVGCVSSTFAASSITVNATPTIAVNSGSICAGNNFTIMPSGASTYTIQGGSAIKTPTANTSYTVVGTNSLGCVSNTFATSSVTVLAAPTITVNSGSVCAGNSFTINPSGASTYTIEGGNAVITPTITSSYTVTGTNALGCQSNLAAISNVTVNSIPTVSISGGAICPGNSFTLSPSGANTYTYSSGSAIVSPTSTTTYSVSGTSIAGCTSSNPAIATVTVANTLTVSITGANSVCNGQAANLTAGGATTYTWNTGATSSTIAPVPSTNTTYSVTGASGTCSNTAVLNVTVNTLPTINATTDNTLMCTGQTASLTASGASTSYTWSTGATGTSISVSPTVTTNYTVTGTDANGCENNAAITQSVSLCTGINQSTNSTNELSVFPNPSSTNLMVKTDEEIQTISIYNSLGELVQIEKTNSFSVEQLSSGLYILKVKTEKGTAITRFIKE